MEHKSYITQGKNYSPPNTIENAIILNRFLLLTSEKKVRYLGKMIRELADVRTKVVEIYNRYPAYFYHMHYTLDNLDKAMAEYQRIADNIRNHGNDTAITAAVTLFR